MVNQLSENAHTEGEFASEAKLWLHFDIAFKSLTDLFADVEANAISLNIHASTYFVCCSLERCEQSLLVFFRYSKAWVLHSHLEHELVFTLLNQLRDNFNWSMSHELDSIREEIQQDLLEASLVKLDSPKLLLDSRQIEINDDFLFFDCLLDKAWYFYDCLY